MKYFRRWTLFGFRAKEKMLLIRNISALLACLRHPDFLVFISHFPMSKVIWVLWLLFGSKNLSVSRLFFCLISSSKFLAFFYIERLENWNQMYVPNLFRYFFQWSTGKTQAEHLFWRKSWFTYKVKGFVIENLFSAIFKAPVSFIQK